MCDFQGQVIKDTVAPMPSLVNHLILGKPAAMLYGHQVAPGEAHWRKHAVFLPMVSEALRPP